MRAVLALCVAACATSAVAAEPVQDRYGPPRRVAVPAAPRVAYDGPTLGWAGKGVPRPAAAPARPQLAARTEPAPRIVQPPAPPAAPPRAEAPARPAPSLYDPPPLARPAAPASQRPTQAAARPEPGPRPAAAPPRLYSLHREYGMTPDTPPAPSARSNYVLIGPGDAPADRDKDEGGDGNAARSHIDARLF